MRILRLDVACAALCGASLLASTAAFGEPLLLRNGRFAVEAHWSTATQQNVPALPTALTNDTGYFTFFTASNVEVVVKVLDACSTPVPRFWVFAAGLTNVDVVIDVTDTWSGVHETFHNPAGTAFAPIQATDVFPTCDTPRPCGLGEPAQLAATPRNDERAELAALVLDGGVVASQATYERVRNDLAAINLLVHSVDGRYEFVPQFWWRDILLRVTPEAMRDIQNDRYTEWNCLNDWYGVTEVLPQGAFPDHGNVNVTFAGRLRVPLLEAEYEALPGVLEAHAYSDPLGEGNEFSGIYFCPAHGNGEEIVYYYKFPARQFRTLPGSVAVQETVDSVAWAECFEDFFAQE